MSMNESGMEVSFSGMNSNGEQTINTAEDLISQLNNLQSEVNDLLSNWYEGGGREAFLKAYNEFHEELHKLNLNVLGLGEGIVAGSKTLYAADQEVADSARNIGGGVC